LTFKNYLIFGKAIDCFLIKIAGSPIIVNEK